MFKLSRPFTKKTKVDNDSLQEVCDKFKTLFTLYRDLNDDKITLDKFFNLSSRLLDDSFRSSVESSVNSELKNGKFSEDFLFKTVIPQKLSILFDEYKGRCSALAKKNVVLHKIPQADINKLISSFRDLLFSLGIRKPFFQSFLQLLQSTENHPPYDSLYKSFDILTKELQKRPGCFLNPSAYDKVARNIIINSIPLTKHLDFLPKTVGDSCSPTSTTFPIIPDSSDSSDSSNSSDSSDSMKSFLVNHSELIHADNDDFWSKLHLSDSDTDKDKPNKTNTGDTDEDKEFWLDSDTEDGKKFWLDSDSIRSKSTISDSDQ